MTHSELIQRGVVWLRKDIRCSVVLADLVAYTQNNERPDLIAWKGGASIVVEAKASRSDFLRDAKKPVRVNGMGNWRFYLASPGIIQAGECLPGWGVYEIEDTGVSHADGARYASWGHPFESPCLASENAILISALRRTQQN